MTDSSDYDHKLDMIAKMNADLLDIHTNLIECYYCEVSPSFGYPTGKRICCNLHKTPGMINLTRGARSRKKAQVEARTLFFKEISKYHLIYNKNTTVKDTSNNKKNVVKRKKCLYYECKKVASFGYIENRPKYCYKHKKPDMDCVKEEEVLIYPTIGLQA